MQGGNERRIRKNASSRNKKAEGERKESEEI